jgi:hypothetical protein
MGSSFGSVGVIGALIYFVFIIIWLAVPVMIYLISKRVKEMRDIARESRLEVKELNASLKFIKRKLNDGWEANKE